MLFDISRLPRLDQYRTVTAGGVEAAQSTPSDIKSIGYFFSDQAAVGSPLEESDSNANGGLYRLEIDRAVAAFSGQDGLRSSPDAFSQLLAPEVAAISFRYFDGTEWAISWDFDEKDGLPTAVEILLTVDPGRVNVNAFAPNDESQRASYRSVVHLPLAEPGDDNEN